MWPNLQETADLATFSEKIFNEKLHFLCSECHKYALSGVLKNISKALI